MLDIGSGLSFVHSNRLTDPLSCVDPVNTSTNERPGIRETDQSEGGPKLCRSK